MLKINNVHLHNSHFTSSRVIREFKIPHNLSFPAFILFPKNFKFVFAHIKNEMADELFKSSLNPFFQRLSHEMRMEDFF